ncbi:DUF1223 domain-containing protein [Jiella mangrovi]|uniref:DUF1223 domain-containing protein n=1 Tax=Jiella mangrovi TaxID=2821407 RepID=A0ABS4BGA4_9HYPH|nr:DUF1223 domain-containing protein [Jiella mangrovi]MBP0615777.1 DUF1223 domain-containing protein [Jiella mangrovi]
MTRSMRKGRSDHAWPLGLAVAAFLTGEVLALPAEAASRPVTVVELFTSQGCSSVPPANRNVMNLEKKPDLLPLSFSVTYWDQLGWKDTFGAEAFTTRQRDYEAGLGRNGPFTPQVVVNGRYDSVGNKADALRAMVAGAKPPADVAIDISGNVVKIGTGAAPSFGADVWLVRYRPGVQSVAIAAGENAGTTLPVPNVVTGIKHVGRWLGVGMSFSAPASEDGEKTAVIVQKPGGPILSAATD